MNLMCYSNSIMYERGGDQSQQCRPERNSSIFFLNYIEDQGNYMLHVYFVIFYRFLKKNPLLNVGERERHLKNIKTTFQN